MQQGGGNGTPRKESKIEEEAVSKLERLGYSREEIIRQLKDESSHLHKLYFRFLKQLVFCFGVVTLCSVPVIICCFGTIREEDPLEMRHLTVAALWNEAPWDLAGTALSLRDGTMLFSVMDALGMLVFLLTIGRACLFVVCCLSLLSFRGLLCVVRLGRGASTS